MARAPVLLVLRVFQRDRAVSLLFDRVIERWRLTGNTLLIAGTDLLERTLDADDLWAFLGGRLRGRFVLGPADLAARLGELELRQDLDGRHRVNELYCHDGTWQLALQARVPPLHIGSRPAQVWSARSSPSQSSPSSRSRRVSSSSSSNPAATSSSRTR